MRSNNKLKSTVGIVSSLNQKKFCNVEGVNYYKFKYWKTQQGKAKQFTKKKQIDLQQDFIPLEIPITKTLISGIEITFPNDIKLGCNQGLGPNQLRELIKLFWNQLTLKKVQKRLGGEIIEILEYNPAQLFVRKIVRPKYAKPNNESLIIAELPSLPISKGNAGASLLAYIRVSKFVDHLPYYRQIQIFKRQNIIISDYTMNGWFNATADLLELETWLKENILQTLPKSAWSIIFYRCKF